MKKLIIGLLLLFSVFTFAEKSGKLRIINECEIVSKGKTKSGKYYMTCKSLKTNKIFHFIDLVEQSYYKFDKGIVFEVEFYGKGNKNLTIETFNYVR